MFYMIMLIYDAGSSSGLTWYSGFSLLLNKQLANYRLTLVFSSFMYCSGSLVAAINYVGLYQSNLSPLCLFAAYFSFLYACCVNGGDYVQCTVRPLHEACQGMMISHISPLRLRPSSPLCLRSLCPSPAKPADSGRCRSSRTRGLLPCRHCLLPRPRTRYLDKLSPLTEQYQTWGFLSSDGERGDQLSVKMLASASVIKISSERYKLLIVA